jgi:hypothetical protein
MARIWLKGHDDVAEFTVSRTTCDYCGRANQVCVTYTGEVRYKKWTWEDIINSTILGKASKSAWKRRNPTPHLGLQCGDYAKFQRQIARITQAMERKAGENV